ncbi:glycoside hydrolase family 3 N-terminal domain-containing protein [Streptomyces sp. NPDC051963]|uniref:glycoside hydrolase family 3 N-terminal domain-containing protein n=1 Tax=Streptomyces sp. NPDC051963 TaxID=3365678 RepID=UPI0037D1F1A8
MHESRLSPAERAIELLARMTRLEKAQQLSAALPLSLYGSDGIDESRCKEVLGHGIGHISAMGNFAHKTPVQLAATTNAIQRYLVERTRLGIPAIVHNEALNGLMAAHFTQFPTAIAQAATWNPDLVEKMTTLTARQMRAVGIHQALSPVMDIARDARWGRVHETWGEDPYLISAFAVAFTRGMQGEDLTQGAIATAKHFLGYGLTEGGQNMATTHLSHREILDVFARPFEAAIRHAGLASVMNSYSDLDGEPVGASRALLTDLLRDTLGFTGSVVSDYSTVSGFIDRQLVARTREEAAALAVSAGLDVELPYLHSFGPHLERAVDQGLVSEKHLDDSVLRVLTAKFRLGLFDQPYVREDAAELHTLPGDGRDLSLDLARQSVTLLKNEQRLLPLAPDLRTIAVIGPYADNASVGFPAYTFPAAMAMLATLASQDSAGMAGIEGMSSQITAEGFTTVAQELGPYVSMGSEAYVRDHHQAETLVEAVRRLAPGAEVRHAVGCAPLTSLDGGLDLAVEAARDAEAVVLAIGGIGGWFGKDFTEGEGGDSADISLPAAQAELVRTVAALGKPCVGVLYQGRPLALGEVLDHLDALVAVPFAGEATGRAAAEAVFGEINPSGKLPVTMPRHSGQVPIYHYQRTGSGYRRTPADIHHGYLDMPATPQFCFGHGLSFTDFGYEDLTVDGGEVPVSGSIELEFTLTNSGPVSGTEIVQLYGTQPVLGMTRPAQELLGFARIHLKPLESARIRFTVDLTQFAYTNTADDLVVDPEPVSLRLGSSSDDIRLAVEVTVSGERRVIDRGERAFFSTVVVR